MLVGYTMLGANDLQRSFAFYDAVLGELCAVRNETWSSEKRTWYQMPGSIQGMLAVDRPFEGEAHGGNGAMVSLVVKDTQTVGRVHAKALSLGAKNEGDPGKRGGDWYGAYFRDFDGNKLAVFTMVRDDG